MSFDPVGDRAGYPAALIDIVNDRVGAADRDKVDADRQVRARITRRGLFGRLVSAGVVGARGGRELGAGQAVVDASAQHGVRERRGMADAGALREPADEGVARGRRRDAEAASRVGTCGDRGRGARTVGVEHREIR